MKNTTRKDMNKNKFFRFTTAITPETDVELSGRYGKPLKMTLTGEGCAKTVLMDQESILQLQAFLADYLIPEEEPAHKIEYIPTGRALAVMDADTLDIVRVFLAKNAVGIAEAEDDNYDDLAHKVETLTDTTLPAKPIFVFYDTFDGTIGRGILRRIVRACISYQVYYVRSGKPSDCRPMIYKDIEAFTGISISTISRATGNVRIVSSAGTFTLNSTDSSLDIPSLFDEGVSRTDGSKCSRKEVFATLLQMVEEEIPEQAMADEDFSDALKQKGYVVERRTVSKYRGMLGIPKWARRRKGR